MSISKWNSFLKSNFRINVNVNTLQQKVNIGLYKIDRSIKRNWDFKFEFPAGVIKFYATMTDAVDDKGDLKSSKEQINHLAELPLHIRLLEASENLIQE